MVLPSARRGGARAPEGRHEQADQERMPATSRSSTCGCVHEGSREAELLLLSAREQLESAATARITKSDEIREGRMSRSDRRGSGHPVEPSRRLDR